MARALTTQERAQRQRVMITLRNWMEKNGVSRQEIADQLGITRGHLSTLINANRTASAKQVDLAEQIMGGTTTRRAPAKKAKPKKKVKPKQTKKAAAPKPKPKPTPKPNKLRPMNKFETEFVVKVAKEWIHANPDAQMDDLVEVVQALSVGIRT